MRGGWGAHLRPLLRDQNGTLWMVVDHGPNIFQNTQLDYYRQTSSGWSLVSSQQNLLGVQQNVASLTDGRLLYSYGNSIGAVEDVSGNVLQQVPRYVEECYFDTQNSANKACNAILINGSPYETPGDTNYIGAAMSPAGVKVVWWTNFGANADPGQFTYIYNYGGGWNGPVVTQLAPFNRFSYGYARFLDSSNFVIAGELLLGDYGGSYTVSTGIAQVHLGDPMQKISYLNLSVGASSSWNGTASDVWINPQNQDIHVLASNAGGVGYFYIKSGTWTVTTTFAPTQMFLGSAAARFGERGDGGINLLLGAFSSAPTLPGVRIIYSGNSISSVISWDETTAASFSVPGYGLHYGPDAIYIESRAYQSTPLGKFTFAFCGQAGVWDNQLWSVSQ